MQKAIHEKTVPTCLEETCGSLVKPEIVFFGEQLPRDFFENTSLVPNADLCIIMGTSLSVHPFASLPSLCEETTPRVLINQEQVGGLGSRPDDVLVLEDCDAGVRKLAKALGWLEELEELWAETAPKEQPKVDRNKAPKTRDEQLQDEINQITKEVEENLKLGEAQHKWLEQHVARKDAKIQERREQPETSEATNAAAAAASIPVKETILHTASPSENEESGLAHVFPFLKKSSL